jgi:hypothetical protein
VELDWGKYTEVADRFQHKARFQDREDLRHDIILRLAEVARNNGHKPLTEPTMYRVASFVVLEYWRELNRPSIKVCVLSGVATKPNYIKCSYRQKPNRCAKCPYLAVRPIESLNQEIEDGEGNRQELIDTLADDDAIDLDEWLDHKRFLLGCPKSLVKIAHKRVNGIPLSKYEQLCLCRFWKRNQKSLL